MNLDQLAALDRLPTPGEVSALCAELGIVVAVSGGKVVLRHKRDLSPAAAQLVQLLKREPWRSALLPATPSVEATSSPPVPGSIEAMPADLPHVLDYRMRSGVVLHALPRRPVEFFSSNGQHNAAVVRPQIPIGADAWRVGDGPWRPLAELPAAWLPYVNRQRPGPMDGRPAPKGET